jgi:hypothetical protein
LQIGIEREVFVAVGRRVDEPLHQLLVHEDYVQVQDIIGGLQQLGFLKQPWEKGAGLRMWSQIGIYGLGENLR